MDVRIAVAVDSDGEVHVARVRGQDDDFRARQEAIAPLGEDFICHIITATLPIPVAQEVKGRVEG